MEWNYRHYRQLIMNQNVRRDFTISPDVPITPQVVSAYIGKWRMQQDFNKYFRNMYRGNHPIFWRKDREAYKPDNRVSVNFAKYIVDTLNSFFIGIPIKITTEDEYATEFLNKFTRINNIDDHNNELSKLCSIYGHAYEMIYIDENADFKVALLSPEQCCVVYDDTLSHDPVFAFTIREDENGNEFGSYCTKDEIVYFKNGTVVNETGREENKLGAVSIIEYVENAEKQSAFENVASMIENYDKVISAKVDDVDYFADAYLKILGGKLTEQELKDLRANRIINFAGDDATDLIVEFLQKPDGDTTQENLINRLERLIFQIAMVSNISDENFGQSSGVALKYKLQSMTNLAQYKETKFKAGMNRRFEIICNAPNYFGKPEDWIDFQYKFTQNVPSNVTEEVQVAQGLSGIVSQRTQLSTLSIVPDVNGEIERIENETPTITDYDGFEHDHE